jgi:hypothetical protein
MKRLLLSLTLVTGILVATTPNARAEELIIPCGGTATYSIIMPAGIAVEGNKYGNQCSGALVIDSRVKIIGELAFDGSAITSVTIPSSVTAIFKRAFRGSKITSLTIPSSVLTIGERAFAETPLMSVNIPNSVTTIGSDAFAYTDLRSLTIPNSVTSIGAGAFRSTNFSSVVIPNSLKSISPDLFSNSELTSVSIPDSVTNIEKGAFSSSKLTSVTIPNSVVTIGESAFAGNPLSSITLSNSLRTIGSYAFNDTKLSSINIPNSVENIGARAFSYTFLTSVVVPNSVKIISEGAFSNNPYLLDISIPDNVDIRLDVKDGYSFSPLQNNSSLARIEYCGKLVGFPITPICPPERKALINKSAALKTPEAPVIKSSWADGNAVIEFNSIKSNPPVSKYQLTVSSLISPQLSPTSALSFGPRAILIEGLAPKFIVSASDINRYFNSGFATKGSPYLLLRVEAVNAQGNSNLSNGIYFEPKNFGLPIFSGTKSTTSTTISCIKGKLSKKVTAVSPKCPSGYKKK